jgi:small subunit ribosomal protein S1
MMEGEPIEEAQSQAESEAHLETLLEEHEDYSPPRPGDIRGGTIIQIGPEGALVNIGFKREGFAPRDDLNQLHRAEMEELQVGDEVPVLILRIGSDEGYVPVSIHKARLAEDWIKAEKLLKSREVHEAEISGYNRGGLTVRFGRIRGFVPLSHIVGLPRRMGETERRARLKEMVGQMTGLQVIEVDRRRRRLIFSQRQAHRSYQRLQKQRLLEELTEGQVITGVVNSITNFGAFVDLGGADGLVHISELSWGRIDDPREVVKIGDEVEVRVLNVDLDRKRIALSLKQTGNDPWETVEQRYQENQLVQGRVTQVSAIGAFVELEPGVEGLLHVSELVGAPAVVPQEVLEPGDEVLVKIVRLERKRRRVGLSARRVQREEWERWAAEKAAQEEQKEAEAPEQPEDETPTAEIEQAEADAAEADATEADAAKVDVVEVDAAEAETAQVDVVEVDAAEAETAQVDMVEVEETKVEAADAEALTSEAESSEPADEAETTEDEPPAVEPAPAEPGEEAEATESEPPADETEPVTSEPDDEEPEVAEDETSDHTEEVTEAADTPEPESADTGDDAEQESADTKEQGPDQVEGDEPTE